MAWRIWPQLNGVFYHRESQNYVPVISGGVTLSGSVGTDVTIPVSGGFTIGGSAEYWTAVQVIGGVSIGGSATRVTESIYPITGTITLGGTAARAGEVTIPVSGGFTLSGVVYPSTSFHYGWWPTPGFWASWGWWWSADEDYHHQWDQ